MKKGRLFLLFFLTWTLQEFPTIAETEALFSPRGNIKEDLLKEIESTPSTLGPFGGAKTSASSVKLTAFKGGVKKTTESQLLPTAGKVTKP